MAIYNHRSRKHIERNKDIFQMMQEGFSEEEIGAIFQITEPAVQRAVESEKERQSVYERVVSFYEAGHKPEKIALLAMCTLSTVLLVLDENGG
jgi:predicted transcriptional regulator